MSTPSKPEGLAYYRGFRAATVIGADFYKSLQSEGRRPSGLVHVERPLVGGVIEFINEQLIYFASLADPLIKVRCAVYDRTARILGCEAEVWVTEDLNTPLDYHWPHPYHRLLVKVTAADKEINEQKFEDRALGVFNALFPRAVMDVILEQRRLMGLTGFDPK